jgi:hypothetical protein
LQEDSNKSQDWNKFGTDFVAIEKPLNLYFPNIVEETNFREDTNYNGINSDINLLQ